MTSLASSVIGRRIQQERRCRGITFSQVEQATGIAAARLRHFERGYETPLGSELFDIAEFYGIEPDRIIRGLTVEMAARHRAGLARVGRRGADGWLSLPFRLRRLLEKLAAALKWV